MTSPIENQIGTIFVPVRDVEKARDWYSMILGVPAESEILFGHLTCIPMQNGQTLALDSKIFSTATISEAPLFHFNTQDVQAAYAFLQANGVEVVSDIQHGHWFTIKDPDGNVLMVCKC